MSIWSKHDPVLQVAPRSSLACIAVVIGNTLSSAVIGSRLKGKIERLI